MGKEKTTLGIVRITSGLGELVVQSVIPDPVKDSTLASLAVTNHEK
jgi:hypothetical protein